ncbi:MAG: TVP38/TMEM64 family protein [Terracoccus sp.]
MRRGGRAVNRRALVMRITLVAVLIGVAVVVQIRVGLPSQSDLRSVLDGVGPAAVPVFIALYVGISLLPAGPTALVTIAGGAVLGLPVALPSVLVGAVLGATVSFLIARRLGGDVVRRVGSDRVRRLDDSVRAHGFGTVLVARLVPLLPFSTLNYAFGLTSVTARSYVLATAVGIVPGTTLFVTVGAYGTRPGSWPFVIAVVGLVLLSLVGVLRSRRSAAS